MKFGSLFSGIGGFDLGFEQAGLSCSWQAEIDKDCQRVLQKHWPNVRRYEDVSTIGKLESVDVICGGFPCQDLSVAGKRAGLAGERSGLWFEFLRIIGLNRPRWIVIENVPGLLSSDEHRDFAAILRGLVECGYRLAWRIVDAQFYGVAQRRRRVFIVGSLGDGSCAEILFESESVSWNPPTRREAGAGATPILEAGARTNGDGRRDGDGIGVEGDPMFTLQRGKQHAVAATIKQRGRGACDEVMDNLQVAGSLASHTKEHGHAMTTQQAAESNHLVAMPLKAKANSSNDDSHETYVVEDLEHYRFHCLTCGQWFGVNDYESNTVTCPNCGETHIDKITDVLDARAVGVRNLKMQPDGTSGTLQHKKSGGHSLNYQNPVLAFSSKDHGADAGEIAPTLRSQNSKDSNQNGGGQVAIAFDTTQITSRENRNNPQDGDPCHPLASAAHAPAIAFTERTRSEGRTFEAQEELAYAITNPGSGGRTHSRQVAGQFGVRRLTPRECERLQGFPEVKREIILEICLDHLKNPADAGNQNRKSQRRVGSAVEIKSQASAKSANRRSARKNQSDSERVPLNVLINCGENEIEICSQEKLLSYANTAGRQSGYPLPIKVENFVPLIAGMSITAEQIIRDGKAASPAHGQCSIHHENGKPLVKLFGKEITRLVSDAITDSITSAKPTKSIISNPSQLSPLEQNLTTSFCSVWTAMIGCIPELTASGYSCLRLRLNTSFGWTLYDANGKEIGDSARYRMLGNAVAVPVARWIGKRIMKVNL